MKIILCGYHWAGCKALEILIGLGYEVYVYTHETKNAVADLEGLCIRRGIPYSLEKISIDNMPFHADVICSIYYRFIISEAVINSVEGKIFNLHPSILPRYRGCSSITWAIINGDNESGYTYHYIDAKCDTGNVILQKRVRIEDFDTQLTLYNRIMFEALRWFKDVLLKVIDGDKGIPQKGGGSYNKRGCPLGGIITDDMDNEQQERLVRAMIYPPYPSAVYKGNTIETYRELLLLKGQKEE